MKSKVEELRKKYISNPPEGMTSEDIRHMSDDALLDMDYFLNEDDLPALSAGYFSVFPSPSVVVVTFITQNYAYAQN